MNTLRQYLRTGILLFLLLKRLLARDFHTGAAAVPLFVEPTRTPFQPVAPHPTPTTAPTLTPEPVRELIAWLDPAVPQHLIGEIKLPAGVQNQPNPAENANLQIGALRGGKEVKATWVYALAAPFHTLVDEISLDEIQRAWRGEPGETFTRPVDDVESTRAAFEARWGPPGRGRVEILADRPAAGCRPGTTAS